MGARFSTGNAMSWAWRVNSYMTTNSPIAGLDQLRDFALSCLNQGRTSATDTLQVIASFAQPAVWPTEHTPV